MLTSPGSRCCGDSKFAPRIKKKKVSPPLISFTVFTTGSHTELTPRAAVGGGGDVGKWNNLKVPEKLARKVPRVKSLLLT